MGTNSYTYMRKRILLSYDNIMLNKGSTSKLKGNSYIVNTKNCCEVPKLLLFYINPMKER